VSSDGYEEPGDEAAADDRPDDPETSGSGVVTFDAAALPVGPSRIGVLSQRFL
jgi:hypothetical protein